MCTYNDTRTEKQRVYEEVAWLGEATGLALKTTAILVQKVWVQQDGELRLRYKERSKETPDLRHDLQCEHSRAEEDVARQVDETAIAQGRHGNS